MSVGPTRGPFQRPGIDRDLTEIFQRVEDLERVPETSVTPDVPAFPDAVAELALTRDLRGYWRLGEAVPGPFADTSGNIGGPADQSRVAVGGSALTHITGALSVDDDGALQFNNPNTLTGDYLRSNGATNSRFNFSSGDADMTVTAFIRPLADANAFRGGVLGTLASSPMAGWGLTVEWPLRQPTLWRRDVISVALSGPSLPASEWSFVAATYDTVNGHKLYLNGALVAVDTTIGNVPAFNQGTYIGVVISGDFASNKLMYGGLDEITCWGGALTAAEIATLAASGDVTEGAASVVATSGSYSASSADDVILASGTSTITLPTAVGITGHRITIKRVGAGTITVARTSSQTIDGAASNVSLTTIQEAREFTSDGTGWQITAAYL